MKRGIAGYTRPGRRSRIARRSAAVGLQSGLLSRAVAQGARNADRWTEEEMASMRKHLDILGASDYACGGDNVTRLR